jgi:hypothetical protein
VIAQSVRRLGYGMDSRGPRNLSLHYLVQTGFGTHRVSYPLGAEGCFPKRSGREANHSPPSHDEIKNAWSYISTPQYVFLVWCLVKHRDNFTFLVHAFEIQIYSYKAITLRIYHWVEYETNFPSISLNIRHIEKLNRKKKCVHINERNTVCYVSFL